MTESTGLLQDVYNDVNTNRLLVQETFDQLSADSLQSDMEEFANSIDAQFAKYGTNFSIESNLNCTDIATSYDEFKEPLCGPVKSGFLELTALRVISLPIEIGLCLLGIRFVIRNRVDVPKYDSTDKTSKKKKGKKGKDKKGKKGGKGKKGEQDAALMEDGGKEGEGDSGSDGGGSEDDDGDEGSDDGTRYEADEATFDINKGRNE